MQDAVNRVYVIKGYKSKHFKTIHAHCSFPSILIGKKVKVVDDDEKEVQNGKV
jgi:hypothetical protein